MCMGFFFSFSIKRAISMGHNRKYWVSHPAPSSGKIKQFDFTHPASHGTNKWGVNDPVRERGKFTATRTASIPVEKEVARWQETSPFFLLGSKWLILNIMCPSSPVFWRALYIRVRFMVNLFAPNSTESTEGTGNMVIVIGRSRSYLN